MKVIFAGTPEFARVAVQSLYAAGFAIPLVLTQPDRPAGRGMKLQASPVRQWAESLHIPVAQPRSLRLDGRFPEDAAAARAAIETAHADVMVVAAYGLILPQWVLDSLHEVNSAGARKLGCLNIHASLLPRWRGAAPIHRAIEAGDAETGVTIMQMDAGLDTGAILLMEKLPIQPTDTTGTLQGRLAALGGRLIVEALELARRSRLKPVTQPAHGVTHAKKIEKTEARVDWRQPVAVIERRIRAFDPFPGAVAQLGPDSIKLWRSQINSEGNPLHKGCGTILSANAEGVQVVAGDGVLTLTELQRAGGKRLPAADFLRGFPMQAGQVFEVPRP
ncbi:MAG: methionyl-tRNA formyltransferase [Polaromonas sp.]|nr:methionyl-tRNA formyltransferase [Polaromonas sp.]